MSCETEISRKITLQPCLNSKRIIIKHRPLIQDLVAKTPDRAKMVTSIIEVCSLLLLALGKIPVDWGIAAVSLFTNRHIAPDKSAVGVGGPTSSFHNAASLSQSVVSEKALVC